MTAKWTQAQAIELCHVALTGGTLYHHGERKDADILFYRIRQVMFIDVDGLMDALTEMGVWPIRDYGWCYKAAYGDQPIDFFFPERDGIEYPGHENPASIVAPIDEPEIVF